MMGFLVPKLLFVSFDIVLNWERVLVRLLLLKLVDTKLKRNINQGELMTSFNEDTLKGKWREIKGEVQKAWGNLTSDELEQTKGDSSAIAGLVQQKYGENKEQFHKKFSEIVNRFHTQKENAVDSVKNSLKN